jgi:hypothetical protein
MYIIAALSLCVRDIASHALELKHAIRHGPKPKLGSPRSKACQH